MTPTIAVVLPAFNEADRIERTIDSIARYVAGGARVGPVILADDGSADRTVEVALRAAAVVGLPLDILRLPHRGKAWTVRSAMLYAAPRVAADYLMMLDADDEIRVDQLDGVEWSVDPRTIYIARRVDQVDGETGFKPSLLRRAMSGAMRAATWTLLGIHYPDTQCGFKLFPRAIVPDLFGQQRSTGWTFDAELLFIADRVSGLPIRQVPVVWVPRGESNVRATAVIASAFSMLGTAWRRARRVYRPISVAKHAIQEGGTLSS